MSHVEVMEIVLQGYMPEVERAPRSPDSRAPASQRLPGAGVSGGTCREGGSAAFMVILSLPCRIQGTAGTVPLGCCRAERSRR